MDSKTEKTRTRRCADCLYRKAISARAYGKKVTICTITHTDILSIKSTECPVLQKGYGGYERQNGLLRPILGREQDD